MLTKTPNEGQAAAGEAIFDFLFDPDEVFFCLNGPAGTGKTFTMSLVIDDILPSYNEACKITGQPVMYTDVIMTATTNKAAEALAAEIKRPVTTIQSALGLYLKTDYSTGRTTLHRSKRSEIITNTVIFIDEAGMMDSELFAKLKELTMHCKIIFVGDVSQLAPVMEEVSPIYRYPYPSATLTEPMRNSTQPALMALCEQFRDTVRTGVFHPIKIVPGVVDHLDDQEMEANLSLFMSDMDHNNRVLAYSNQRVIDYNSYIRQMRNLPEAPQAGETFINNTSFPLGNRQRIGVDCAVKIHRVSGEKVYNIAYQDDPETLLDVWVVDLLVPNYGVKMGVMIPKNPEHFREVLKYYRRKKLYYHVEHLQSTYIDLRPADASTVHKAQGSSFDNVFIDLQDLSTCHNPKTAARLFYVAVSRARSRIFFYGGLAPKYGNIVHALPAS